MSLFSSFFINIQRMKYVALTAVNNTNKVNIDSINTKEKTNAPKAPNTVVRIIVNKLSFKI